MLFLNDAIFLEMPSRRRMSCICFEGRGKKSLNFQYDEYDKS